MEEMIIKGIIFDFIGTTVIEKDASAINQSFTSAFRDHGLLVGDEEIKAGRGKDKKEMIAGVLKQFNQPLRLVLPILDSFREHLKSNMGNFIANEGSEDIFRYMQQQSIAIALGTGLPRDIFEQIFRHLSWNTAWFDYIGISEEIGKGRPHPDMINAMLRQCRLSNEECLKVGDTISDIQEGKNAGVLTAAILSGTQREKELLAQQPDFVIRSLGELKSIVNRES